MDVAWAAGVSEGGGDELGPVRGSDCCSPLPQVGLAARGGEAVWWDMILRWTHWLVVAHLKNSELGHTYSERTEDMKERTEFLLWRSR